MDEIEDIIAERKLTFVSDSGERTECRLVFGMPYNPGDNTFNCPFQIIGHGDQKICEGYGVDGLQALTIAIEKANVILNTCGGGVFLFDESPELHLYARDLRQ